MIAPETGATPFEWLKMHIPKASWRDIREDPSLRATRPWFLILLASLAVYSDYAPDIAQTEWVTSISEFIPSIRGWVARSPFPDNTRLLSVVVWCMVPLQTYWVASDPDCRSYMMNSYAAKLATQSPSMRAFGFLYAAICLIGLALVVALYPIHDLESCRRFCVNSERWFQLFAACFFSLTMSICFGFLATTISFWVRLFRLRD